jgi:hypothetical protein
MCKTVVLQVTFCAALPCGNELGHTTQLQGCNVLRKNILYKKLKLHTKHWKVSVSLSSDKIITVQSKCFQPVPKQFSCYLLPMICFRCKFIDAVSQLSRVCHLIQLLTLTHYNQLHSRIQTISNPHLGHSGLFLNLSVAHVHSSSLIQCLFLSLQKSSHNVGFILSRNN